MAILFDHCKIHSTSKLYGEEIIKWLVGDINDKDRIIKVYSVPLGRR